MKLEDQLSSRLTTKTDEIAESEDALITSKKATPIHRAITFGSQFRRRYAARMKTSAVGEDATAHEGDKDAGSDPGGD